MKYVSTRGEAPAVSFSEAILAGLAPDGGLYVPERFPDFEDLRVPERGIGPRSLNPRAPFAETVARFLRPFLAGDLLAPELESICREAFDFPVPLEHMARRTALLDLTCGPTAAFKDFGARFLAACFERLLAARPELGRLRVLVATSGDTGAAVAAACHRRPAIEVAVLFPADGVSPRQRHQLTCWDENVRSFAVRGSFDDCQRVVKAAFRDPRWRAAGALSSANSINVGRLLPQAAYYAYAAARYRAECGETPGVIVPSGNVGNSVGAFWAMHSGFPLRRIALATNANRVVPEWFRTGRWEPRPSVATLANAMDVGDPSNMERLFDLYENAEAMGRVAESLSVDDATIRATIAAGPARWGRVWDPHTATAVHYREQLDSEDWIVVATAHPAKFDAIVEPLVGHPVPVPPALAALLARPTHVETIEPRLEDLEARLGLQR